MADTTDFETALARLLTLTRQDTVAGRDSEACNAALDDLLVRQRSLLAERDRLATEARQATQAVGAIVAAAGGSVIVRPAHLKENWLLKRTEDGTGTFWYFAERIVPPDESQHVCGLSGYNGMIDPPCPACVARRAPSTGGTP